MTAARYIDHGADREAADRHIAALARSSHVTADGRPPYPRCDSGTWGDPRVQQGRLCPPCPCPARDRPREDCPYVTRRHVRVHRIQTRDGDAYVVPVTTLHEQLRGEVVDVDGIEVEITDEGARELDAEERESLEPATDNGARESNGNGR